MAKFIFYLRFILCVFILQSCNNKASKDHSLQSSKISVVDASNTRITLDSVASKVVVLFDSSLDHIYMLGAQDKLVGIPQVTYMQEDKMDFLGKLDSRLANKSITAVTFNGRSSNAEQIVALRPDLVISYIGDYQSIEQLRALGLTVYSVQTSNQKDMFKQVMDLGILLGKQDRASEIVKYIEGQLDTLKQKQVLDKKKVYYAWSKGRILSTSGKGTLVDMVMDLAGATNACTLEMESPNIGAELLYQWNPDLIVLWDSSLNEVYGLAELQSLPAVKNKQVYQLSPAFYYDPHTVKFLLFARQLNHWCYFDSPSDVLQEQIAADIEFLYKNNKQ
ncbi:ABC transporter substrate-binding protein [Myroides sp. LJL119]